MVMTGGWFLIVNSHIVKDMKAMKVLVGLLLNPFSILQPPATWDPLAEFVRSSALCAERSASRPGPRCDPSMRKPPAGRTNLSSGGDHRTMAVELHSPKTGSGNM